MTRRDTIIVATIALVGILTAAPGVHLFRMFLSPFPAFAISHGAALMLIGLAFHQWRVRRAG